MAGNADFVLEAAVLPDLSSAKKAGAALRAEIEKALAGLPADIREAAVGSKRSYLSGLSGATSGQALYTNLSNIRAGIKRGVIARSALDSMTIEQEDAVRAVDELIKQRTNLARRVYVNEPVNKRLAQKRLATKVEEATKTLGAGLPSDFVDKYMAAQESGDTKTLAKLSRQYKAKALAARTVLQNPALATDAKYGAAMSVVEVQDEIKNRERQQQDAVKDNTKALKTLSVIATNVVATGLKTFAAALPTYWHESVTRSTFGRMAAEAERRKIYGKGIGTGAGNIAGGIIGGLIGGPAGAMIGASVLGNVGGTIGSLSGKYGEERLQSVQKTIAQINERYRTQGIYGGQMSVGYAAAVQETGMASAGDVEKMVHNSATLGARMMFGQVGENEMLMYSLMPGYFAAAMNGASDAELASAFAADLNRLPPQLRVWAAEGVGGGSLGMMAYSNSPTFSYVQGNAGKLRSIDSAIMAAGAGFHVQSGVRGVLDRVIEEGDVYGDVADLIRRPREGLYLPTGAAAELAVSGYHPAGEAGTSALGLPTKVRTLRKLGISDSFMMPSYYRTAARSAGSSELDDVAEGRTAIGAARERILQPMTININVDGETIKSQDVVNEIPDGTLLTQTLGF